MNYTVRTRYGWGWEVIGPNGFQSMPIETAISAEIYANALTAGKNHEQAMLLAALHYNNGRLYLSL